MVVATGAVVDAPVLTRLPRWIARPVMVGGAGSLAGPGRSVCGRKAR